MPVDEVNATISITTDVVGVLHRFSLSDLDTSPSGPRFPSDDWDKSIENVRAGVSLVHDEVAL